LLELGSGKILTISSILSSSIALRIHVDEDSVSYDTERWTALPDQHFVWTVTLDEQVNM
jgi:hypothetical protein